VRDVRHRLARDGPPWTRDRADDFDTVTVPERDCDALRDLLIAEGVETIVEIGLAYGSSALAIGEALVSVGATRPFHVIIDPLQATEWSNVGWQMLRSAGLDTIARLVLQPSSMALPQLIAEGLIADAAFVDGSHRFHEVFVDLYFLRKIVRPGGIIVLDDHWWPLSTHRGTLLRDEHGVAGRPRRLRRWHDRPSERTHTRTGSALAQPCIRTGIRALPAVLMWQWLSRCGHWPEHHEHDACYGQSEACSQGWAGSPLGTTRPRPWVGCPPGLGERRFNPIRAVSR